jgi:hypothetical protein
MLEIFSIEVLVRIGLIVVVAIVLSVVYSMAIRKLLSRNAGKKKAKPFINYY